MSEEEVKANKAKASTKKIRLLTKQLIAEFKNLDQLVDGIEFVEVHTEVRMKIRKLQ